VGAAPRPGPAAVTQIGGGHPVMNGRGLLLHVQCSLAMAWRMAGVRSAGAAWADSRPSTARRRLLPFPHLPAVCSRYICILPFAADNQRRCPVLPALVIAFVAYCARRLFLCRSHG